MSFTHRPVSSTESFLKESAKLKQANFATVVKITVFEGHHVVAFHDHTLAYNEEGKPHYLDVFQTPMYNTSGQPRAPDDFQPKAKDIKKLVKEGKLSIKDDQSITSFSKKYIVAKEYVVNAVRLND